ncbi:hypothetical protein EVAR_59881_1 [Eumeta japonica]|uniref:Uncharacterized protein n=1 Tax=Eumeta variegata TaxID=151549 RepID=A0A4C1XR90_EUMVA|nr:hypothetical protein EVAR_59881_1 [Eumeta japonica]
MVLTVFPARGTMTKISGRDEVEQLFWALLIVYAIQHARRCYIFRKASELSWLDTTGLRSPTLVQYPLGITSVPFAYALTTPDTDGLAPGVLFQSHN